MPVPVVLLPDAGPLITLAYADRLDLLLRPRWSVMLVDMVLYEVTRNQMLRPALFPTLRPKPFKVEKRGLSRTASDITGT